MQGGEQRRKRERKRQRVRKKERERESEREKERERDRRPFFPRSLHLNRVFFVFNFLSFGLLFILLFHLGGHLIIRNDLSTPLRRLWPQFSASKGKLSIISSFFCYKTQPSSILRVPKVFMRRKC